MKLELKSPLTHFVYGAGVAQPVERGAVNPFDAYDSDFTQRMTSLLDWSYGRSYALSRNPFSVIREEDIKEFLKYAKVRYSKDYYGDITRYLINYGYLEMLMRDDLSSFAAKIQKETRRVRKKVFEVLGSLSKYLNGKYNTEAFSEYIKRIRNFIGIKWSYKPTGLYLVTLGEVKKALEIAIENDVHTYIKIWFLVISGTRPIYTRMITWDNIVVKDDVAYAYIGRVEGTKRTYIAALTLNLASTTLKFKGIFKKPFSTFREREWYTLKAIKSEVPHWNYYALRHLNANMLLLGGLSEAEIDFLQGRTDISAVRKQLQLSATVGRVLRRHYLHLDEEEILREVLKRHNNAVKIIDVYAYELFLKYAEYSRVKH